MEDFVEWFHQQVSEANIFEDLIQEISKMHPSDFNIIPNFKIVQSYKFLYEMLLGFVNDFKLGFFPFEAQKTKIFTIIPDKLFEISNSTITFYIVNGVIDFDTKLTWIGIPFFAQDRVHYYDENGVEIEMSILNKSIESIFDNLPAKSSALAACNKFSHFLRTKRWKDLVQVLESSNSLQIWILEKREEYSNLYTLKHKDFAALIAELGLNKPERIIQSYIQSKNTISCDNAIDLVDLF